MIGRGEFSGIGPGEPLTTSCGHLRGLVWARQEVDPADIPTDGAFSPKGNNISLSRARMRHSVLIQTALTFS
jgi:hypothetical protein